MDTSIEVNFDETKKVVNVYKNQDEDARKQAFNKIWCEIINFKERQKLT